MILNSIWFWFIGVNKDIACMTSSNKHLVFAIRHDDNARASCKIRLTWLVSRILIKICGEIGLNMILLIKSICCNTIHYTRSQDRLKIVVIWRIHPFKSDDINVVLLFCCFVILYDSLIFITYFISTFDTSTFFNYCTFAILPDFINRNCITSCSNNLNRQFFFSGKFLIRLRLSVFLLPFWIIKRNINRCTAIRLNFLQKIGFSSCLMICFYKYIIVVRSWNLCSIRLKIQTYFVLFIIILMNSNSCREFILCFSIILKCIAI